MNRKALNDFVEKRTLEAENRMGEMRNYLEMKFEKNYQSILKEVKQEMERRKSSYETQE